MDPYVVVLGIAQDGGVPQAGSVIHEDWENASRKRHVVCLGLIDPVSRQRWMVEATPDFKEQLHMLDREFPMDDSPGLDGIFLTHAHIGHYTGLMFLGHESLGSSGIKVHVMPGMSIFLQNNGPWNQLVNFGNIVIELMKNGVSARLNERLSITPFIVPHRQEYSEVVGFIIRGPRKSVLFLPDIDNWADWENQGTKIESLLTEVDIAFLDGTFYAECEIPCRDISTFPHPFITRTMSRLEKMKATIREKVRFIHLNHSNPVLWEDSDARKTVMTKGFKIAKELECIGL